MTRLTPIPFNKVKIDSGFWSPRLEIARKETVRVCLDKCEETGRLSNFRKAAGRMEGKFQGIYFDDSDVYKVLEGAAYCLMHSRDEELEARVDGIIDDIVASQQPDGYINSYYTLTGLEKRWTDMGMHEAYCIGHMVEGAVAYHQATGKDAWLRCAERVIAHMMDRFGPGKLHWVTGHQELELALIRLYRHTGKREYYDFAQWLIHERGHGHMAAASLDSQSFFEEYSQNAVPAAEQTKVTGHAVRAMYYYTAMADADAVSGAGEYTRALDALWHNVVPANYYITGGIGQSAHNEGFTRDYHKPNLTAYCETCAAIGMAMWNHRLNLASADAKYADIVETEMYNGALAGISLDGKRFFYENPLASVGNHHRRAWYGCSCCPTNLARFIPSVGGYAYALGEKTLVVNQYIAGGLEIEEDGVHVQLQVETDYPWDGRVALDVKRCDGVETLRLRIPGWCRKWDVSVPGAVCEDGYLVLPVAQGDRVVLTLDMPVDRVYEDERVQETKGRVAIRRGPVLYCAEEVDNPGIPTEYFHCDTTLPKAAGLTLGAREPALMNVPVIRAGELKLIPYALWDNRERGAMVVWMKEA